MSTRKFFSIVAASLLLGCVSATPAHSDSNTGINPDPQSDPCQTKDSDLRVVINVNQEKKASICRSDDKGDCLYTFSLGKTFLHSKPDLNSDGHNDYIIKDFSGAYGMHDVTHFLGFLSCRDGSYVKVLDNFFTDLQPIIQKHPTAWITLRVSRSCFDEKKQDVVKRWYSLNFDKSLLSYGPPDNKQTLNEYCSAYELSLPPSEEK